VLSGRVSSPLNARLDFLLLISEVILYIALSVSSLPLSPPYTPLPPGLTLSD